MGSVSVPRLLRAVTRLRPSFVVRAALAAGLMLAVAMLCLAVVDASTQRALSVTAEPPVIPADGGQTTIVVRLPVDAAAGESHVTLSTELGAFTSANGPPEIRARLDRVDRNTMGASVKLFADRLVGSTVVRAQVGQLVDTVTVRFVGETTSLRMDQPSNAKLDAARSHLIRLVAADETGAGAPSVEVTLRFIEAPAGATLRSSARSSTDSLTLRTNGDGEVSARLQSKPGAVTLEALSGQASLEMSFEFYGEPRTLRLVAIDAGVERGDEGDEGSIQALLLDERGQGVPGERIVFAADSGLVVGWDGDGESPITDSAGTARVHLDGANARLGPAEVSASWSDGERSLDDDLTLAVTGTPMAMYLTASVTYAVLDEVLLEEFNSSTRYRVEAEVVDELGQPVAGSYRIRWRPRLYGAAAQVYPQVTWTEDGVASAIFDLQHVNGTPQPDQTDAQAWLMDRAQVNNVGRIADLIGDGLPLRRGRNDLVWAGDAMSISEAVAPIAHAISAAWRQIDGGWQAWFPSNIPGAVDFQLQPGDGFHLELRTAALLDGVSRQ